MNLIEGIVIKTEDIKESDKLITLFSSDLGKLKLVAKGGRKIKAKITPHLDLFNLVSAGFVEGRYFKIMTSAIVKERFSSINDNLLKLSGAFYLSDIFDRLSAQEDGHDLYPLLKEAFCWIDTAESVSRDDLNLFLRYIEYKLLKVLGFMPIKDYCLNCRQSAGLAHRPTTEGDMLYFNIERGGVVCKNCALFNDRFILIKKSLFSEIENKLAEKNRVLNSAVLELDDFRKLTHGFINYYMGEDPGYLNNRIFEILK